MHIKRFFYVIVQNLVHTLPLNSVSSAILIILFVKKTARNIFQNIKIKLNYYKNTIQIISCRGDSWIAPTKYNKEIDIYESNRGRKAEPYELIMNSE